ncbi:hypothetical protein NB724_004288 [Pantoea ananatis]|nr:hypothetical protein [Pantoea ananatis]MCW0337276.1 hypothetical protein [Pantoea ananatis]MCW0385459.1 hypothetical protein [Pantoea ananatis]MCW0410122.1 hypothetical protein [Pantoea ananatis]MCW0430297.1 hypothetical protein [Pantoea ananatis]
MQAVEEAQPAAGKVGEVTLRQTCFQGLRRQVRGDVPARIAQHPVDFIPARRCRLVNRLLNAPFPRLAGEHARHHFPGGEQSPRIGTAGHVFQRHIGKVTTHGFEHVLIQRAFSVTPPDLLQQHLTALAHQLRIRRDFPLWLFWQFGNVEGPQIR